MAKLSIVAGTTSKRVKVFIQDSSVTTGAGLTGLVFNTASLTAYYIKEGDSSATVITLVTATLGTWVSGGFKVVDATNMPGLYELDLPNAAIATGAKSVVVYLQGAANMAPVVLEIELDRSTSYALVKNVAFTAFPFLMTDSTTHLPKTGATVTATRSLDGAAFGACANSPTELSNGVYLITLAAADTNANSIVYRFTATGADDRFITVITQS